MSAFTLKDQNAWGECGTVFCFKQERTYSSTPNPETMWIDISTDGHCSIYLSIEDVKGLRNFLTDELIRIGAE